MFKKMSNIFLGILVLLLTVFLIFILANQKWDINNFEKSHSKITTEKVTDVEKNIEDENLYFTSIQSSEYSPKPKPIHNRDKLDNGFYKIFKKIENFAPKEISLFNNRNTLLYISNTNEVSNIYAVDYDQEYSFSKPLLLDKVVIEKNEIGFSNISTGENESLAMYRIDNDLRHKIILNYMDKFTKEDIKFEDLNAITSNIVFDRNSESILFSMPSTRDNKIKIFKKGLLENERLLIYNPPFNSKIIYLDKSMETGDIVFIQQDLINKNNILYLYNNTKRELIKISNDTYSVNTAKISKSGEKIVYSAFESDNNLSSDIFVFYVESKNTIKITENQGNNSYPGWTYFNEDIMYINNTNASITINVVRLFK